jgi:hypothetical protein
MGTWIIPYVDRNLDFWDEVQDRFGDQVREVYCPVPDQGFASGRGRQPERHLYDFLRNAPQAKSVLLNPIVLSRPVEVVASEALPTLQWLQNEFGLRRVTITNPTLAARIKERMPDWHVTASVLMGIVHPVQAWLVQDCVDAITASGRLVRDLAGLKQLRSGYGGEIRLIVNEACLPGCLFRTQHFYEMAYNDGLPRSLCEHMLEKHPWLRLTGAWVLPRHLALYNGLCDGLKLAGRVTLQSRDRYLAVLGSYVNREPILPKDIGGGPASPLEAIDVSDEWFEFVLRCDKQCHTCSVCREQYAQARQKLNAGR